MASSINTDILIVGAGPVGAHAAHLLASKGFIVTVIEKNERSRCGAQWVNGVPFWQLSEAGLQMPPDNEIYHKGGHFSIISPLGNSRITLKNAPILDIDMRLFGLRLLGFAESHKNIDVHYETNFRELQFDEKNRPVAALTSKGPIRFKLIIDASGLSAVVRKQIPLLQKLCPRVEAGDLCTAAQEVCEIQDRHAAESFLEQNRALPGEALAWVNIAGGFSLLRVNIDPHIQRVAFLTGSRALPGIPSAKELIRSFAKDHSFVGKTLFGGQRPVPLRRPYAALSAPGIALIGDAACQVYSAHASGIGISLVAAQILSQTIANAANQGEDIGDAQVLSRYAHQFHKQFGSLLANSDASRRFSQSLSKEETHILIERKMMTNKMISDSLFQRPVGLHLPDLPGQLLQAVKHPLLAQRVLRVAAKLPAISALMKLYPREAHKSPEKLARFERRLETLVSL